MKRKHKWPYKETPRERIRKYREQYETLCDRYDTWISSSPPSLCDYCQEFWYEAGFEDSDCGCNVSQKFSNWPDIMTCKWFKPRINWKSSLDERHIDTLLSILDKALPWAKDLKSLEKDLKSLENKKNILIYELESLKKKNTDEIEYHKRRLAKLIPAEVLNRMLESESEISQLPTFV